MESKNPRLIKVKGAAFRIHRDYGIQNPNDLCIEDIAMAEDLFVTIGPLNGADGRLIRQEKKGIVRISDSIREATRTRFTMTHELGHWMLHKNESQFFLCTEGDMYDYQSNQLEAEANQFSAEVLMPKHWIDKKFWLLEPSISRIKEISNFFNVSLTAASLRFTELSKHTCMVVFSDGKQVRWWRKKNRLPFWLNSRQMISLSSHAYECYKNGLICSGMDSVDPEAWFPHSEIVISELMEESVYMQTSGIIISLLWFPSWS